MDQRISIITLGVRDLAAARSFYQRLGFTEAGISQQAIAFYDMGIFAFALYAASDLADDIGEPLQAPGKSPVTLAYNVHEKGEVATILAEAEAAGGRIVKPAQDVFWGGHSGYFTDPDGHYWEVAWNPHSPLDAAGALRIS